MGIPEQQWESYKSMKQWVIDTIAASKGTSNNPTSLAEAQKVEISYCTCVGRYKPGVDCPISVTFQKREDKEQLLKNKRNLPPSLYMNEEFPIQIKKARNRLRPLFKMVKSNPKYKDKCKMSGDKLVIDGIKYSMDNLADLPPDLAAYQAAEKSNESTLVFHGELLLYSNFYPSPFRVNGILFKTAEHFIQYQKALLFGDSVTANQILRSDAAIDAKCLSYNINEFNRSQWINEGTELCVVGIREKFIQNTPLLEMLKTTAPKKITEASNDKLWGTGVKLRDKNALNMSSWEGPGWLSEILTTIRDKYC